MTARSPSALMKFKNAPACSGIVAAKSISSPAPSSARSTMWPIRSKLTLAPDMVTTQSPSGARPARLCFMMPAKATAPAGSTTVRVASKTSLTAAHISSFVTVIHSSTTDLDMSNVLVPMSFTATPSAKPSTLFSGVGLPASSDVLRVAAPSGSTAMILVSGDMALTHVPMPETNPPPPVQT